MPSFSSLASIWGLRTATTPSTVRPKAPPDSPSSTNTKSKRSFVTNIFRGHKRVKTSHNVRPESLNSNASFESASSSFEPAAPIAADAGIPNYFVPVRLMADISSPDTTIFAAASSKAETDPNVDDADEMDLADSTPSPVDSSNEPKFTNLPPETDSRRTSNQKAPGVNKDTHNTSKTDAGNEIPTPIGARLKRQPIPQSKRAPQLSCHEKIMARVKREVSIETGDDIPKNYTGTWDGMRFYKPEPSPGFYGCAMGTHHLTCGHFVHDGTFLNMIVDKAAAIQCGINCDKPNFEEQPFKCPECRKIVVDVLENKLTEVEKAKIVNAKQQGAPADPYIYGFVVEMATKYTELEGNITETVMWLLDNGFGRECTVGKAPEPIAGVPLEEMVYKIYEKEYRKAAEDEAKMNQKKKGSKRKDADSDLSDEEKQKATDSKQVQNRYYKPTAPAELFSAKRIRMFNLNPVALGSATYLAPPANVVGALMRKRELPQYAYMDGPDATSNNARTTDTPKKMRMAAFKMPGGDVAPKWKTRGGNAFTKVRCQLPEFVPTWYCDDEDL
ncbi:hypothetical protein K504DRAFT_457723 [Pleomassaria siparia CBS 279.74]|uniref:Uncharacterized protein n=1 Tax=Pleomassaria siparia CBS 279.74 TaxID=1314801 RepID=A0A6G1KRY2_9PLEO|nr:hypothetical protein K504DRAFT_457723 [Pleomassaria siparia CBS 279.74]